MAETTPPDKSPDRIAPNKPLEGADRPYATPPSTSFESYMKDSSSTAPSGPPSAAMSPMEAAKGNLAPASGPPSFDSLTNQAKNAQDSLGIVGNQLQDSNLKLKRAQSHLLRNKLQDANSYIRSAGSKVGLDAPAMKMTPGASPLDRFISYVNDGQAQLLAVQEKLKEMAASGDSIRPGDMMQIQVKMNLAQQAIEYSSTLLGKVIDSVKQMMNIQL